MFTATKENERDEKLKEVKNTAQRAKNDVRDAAEDFGDEVRSAAHRTGRSVRELWHTASDEVSHVSDNVTSQIRNKPVQSTLIALAAGFVIGALVRR